MYYIKKITLDEKERYLTSKIMEHAKSISSALCLLEHSVKDFVREECGKQASDNCKIIDIHDFSQINDPIIDSTLVYRLDSDPHRLHVFQRKTKSISGYIYGQSLIAEFRKIEIFELEEYDKINPIDLARKNSIDLSTTLMSTIPPIELVPVGSARILVPKQMTVSPMCDLIKELKQSLRFKAKFVEVNSAAPSESAPNIK